MAITHKPKAGALLTGTEYEAADAHEGTLTAAEVGAAPDDATYLVTTANAGLSAEVAVGATPGGELGGTWASPTVDASHSGSTHAATQAAAEATAASALTTHEGAADPHTVYLKESDFAAVDALVGTATGLLSGEIVVGTSPGGELGGTWASPTVDTTHSGSAHHPAPLIDVSAGSVVSSTSFADTDMAIAVAANTNYRIWAAIFFNTNATTVGIRIAFNGPASPTLFKVGGFVSTGAAGTNDSTIAQSAHINYDTPYVTTSGPGATNAVSFFSGVLMNGSNAGTLVVRHASETATTTTIEAGSFLELQQF